MELDYLLNNLAELHLHLGASSSPHFLWELAHQQGIRVPEKNYWKFLDLVTISKKTTSDKYLRRLDVPEQEQVSPFALTQRIQSSPEAVEKCVHNAISSAYRLSSVSCVEVRFNPMLRNRHGERDLDKTILSATIGLKKACLEYPVRAGLILETDRQFTKQQHIIIAQKAAAFRSLGIVGIDISGPSLENFNLDDWVEAVRIAKTAGLGITIHTGEVTSVAEMWQVVNKIAPHRIGHGIRAVSDTKLMQELARRNIVLELCPTSNIRTRVVKNWHEMGAIIKTFKKHHVPFIINSDGPEFLQTTVRQELVTLWRKNIITADDIKNITQLAHRASFIQ